MKKYLILLLVKKLDEGDGASLAAVDHNFFRISEKADIADLKIDNMELQESISSLEKGGLIIQNHLNNYVINEKGSDFLINNVSFKDELKGVISQQG